MANSHVLRYLAQLIFQDDPPTNEAIAQLLVKAGILETPNKKTVARLIQEAGKWLLERDMYLAAFEQPRLDKTLSRRIFDTFSWRTPLYSVIVPMANIFDPDKGTNLVSTPATALRDYLQARMNHAQSTKHDLHIAFSGGKRILDCVSSFEGYKRPHVHFYASAAIGRGTMRKHSHITPEVNATIAWERSGMVPGNLHYVSIPPPVPRFEKQMSKLERHEAALQMLREHAAEQRTTPMYAGFIKDLEAVDLIVCEITSVDGRTTPLADGLLETYGINLDLLKASKVIGSLNYQLFFDWMPSKKGNPADHHKLKKLFICAGDAGYPEGFGGVEDGLARLAGSFRHDYDLKTEAPAIHHLERIPDTSPSKAVIALGEYEEWRAVDAAISGGLVNIVCTDQLTARIIAPTPLPESDGPDADDAIPIELLNGYDVVPRLKESINLYRHALKRDIRRLRETMDDLTKAQASTTEARRRLRKLDSE